MAINFINAPQPGLYPSPGMATAAGWAGIGQDVAGAIGEYKKAKKQKEDEAYQKAIEQMALTGILPTNAAEIFKQRYGAGFDPSTVRVSDLGRKMAGLKTDFGGADSGITPDMLQQAQQGMINEGLGLKTPEELQKAAADRVSAYLKATENIDVDGKPPASFLKDWEAAGFGSYPMMQGAPDPTGMPTTIPVPIKSAKRAKEIQDDQKVVNDTIKLALRGQGYGGIEPSQVPAVIDAEMANKYGPDWKLEKPDVALLVQRSLDAAFPPEQVEPETPAEPSEPTLFDNIAGMLPTIGANAAQALPASLGPAGSAAMVWKQLWDRFLPQSPNIGAAPTSGVTSSGVRYTIQ